MCAEWEQAFIEVAQTAKSQQPDEKIAFGIVKYDTLPEVFRSYNLNHAPSIIYVPFDLQETKKMLPKLTMNLANLVSRCLHWISAN
jgi:OST3 / OST6 family, transporter family